MFIIIITGLTPLRVYGNRFNRMEWNYQYIQNILSLLKVKYTLKPAKKAQSGSRDIALLFL